MSEETDTDDIDILAQIEQEFADFEEYIDGNDD